MLTKTWQKSSRARKNAKISGKPLRHIPQIEQRQAGSYLPVDLGAEETKKKASWKIGVPKSSDGH